MRGTAALTAEVLVIGGGLAGGSAAAELALRGYRAVLVERDAGPRHKVCGEFLSVETVAALRGLGVDPEALGAVRIERVRLCRAGGQTEVRLPFRALSLTRRRLDEELLRAAEAAGVRVLRGRGVERLERAAGRWCAALARTGAASGDAVEAASVFVATGKHDLRARPRVQRGREACLGLKMYFRLAPAQAAALAGVVELHTFRGGYAGLQCVEDGVANLCCAVKQSAYAERGGGWSTLLEAMQRSSEVLRERLCGAEALLAKPLAISPVPYGFVRARGEEGAWYLGDQAAVIPSFTGDGMAIALHSGRLAAQMFAEGACAAEFQRHLHAQVRGQVRLASAVSRGLLSRWSPWLTAGAALAPGVIGWLAEHTRLQGAALAPEKAVSRAAVLQ